MRNEDYSNAKTLAKIEFQGEQFRIVRRRVNGKPWRGYLALVHGGTYVAGLSDGCTDPAVAKTLLTGQLEKCFATREALLASLGPILEKHKPGAWENAHVRSATSQP